MVIFIIDNTYWNTKAYIKQNPDAKLHHFLQKEKNYEYKKTYKQFFIFSLNLKSILNQIN